MEENKKIQLSFEAIEPYILKNSPTYEERVLRGKDYVTNGDCDDYPNYLYQLYTECPILGSIINGTSDFVLGNDIKCNVPGFERKVNKRGETVRELIGKCAVDFLIFGGFYIQVIRNNIGNISELYWLDYRYMRTNKKNEVFYYSEDYGKKYARTTNALVYPKFMIESNEPASVIFIKSKYSRNVYSVSPWASALKSVITEIEIDKFHLGEICNNFAGSAIINFNNGVPEDEQKRAIEKSILEKFSGAENAGRFILSFNDGKENETTINRLQSDDFDDRYQALAKKTKEQIFIAFGASANLFGVSTDNKGFAEEEYEESFRLYNRTRIRPIQQVFSDLFDKVFQMENTLTIEPYSFTENNQSEEIVQ